VAVKRTEEALALRGLLAANIKKRRRKLAISQEKLAELADISVQTVNFIEGCRTWVSDKTLAKLAGVLRVEAYSLLAPLTDTSSENALPARADALDELRSVIVNDIDKRFDEFITKSVSRS
jgi:transcriptional regulator with XRE-family HTH domain